MITLKNLAKIYRTTEVETTAIRDMNLEIRAGEFVAVMGPSGCGKSTFLNIVGMLDGPSAGEYWFDGQNIACYAETKLAQLRKNAIGFVFQSFNLIDELSVRENVELALLYHSDVSAGERRKRANEALERVHIHAQRERLPGQHRPMQPPHARPPRSRRDDDRLLGVPVDVREMRVAVEVKAR